MGLANILFISFIITTMSRNLSFCLDHHRGDLSSNRCSNDFNCSANAYCHQSGICECKEHYIPYRELNIPGKKAYHTLCLKEASFIGDHCKKDIQCQTPFGLHSECFYSDSNSQLGLCQCSKDAHYKDDSCYKTAFIGDRCEVNNNCFTQSKNIQAYCDIGRCICPPMYHPTVDAFDCQPSSGLGGPCLNDAGCMTLNSECRHGFCRCKKKYTTGDQNTYCLLLAEKLEDPCEVHDQCTVVLQNARCDEQRGVCVCENGAHSVDGTCWKTVRFLEPCKYNPECLVDKGSKHGITCKEGLCQCRDGYVIEEQSYCLKDNNTNTSEASTGPTLSPKMLIYGGLILIINFNHFKRGT